MILSPENNQYATGIESSISAFTGFQIAASFALPSNICKYDKIQVINDLLKKLSSGYRHINRRANIESFLMVLSDKTDRVSLFSVLVRHDSHLLEKTVQDRIWMIQGMVAEVDANANVFKPYNGFEYDLQRYHLKDNSDSYSINILERGTILKLEDCAVY